MVRLLALNMNMKTGSIDTMLEYLKNAMLMPDIFLITEGVGGLFSFTFNSLDTIASKATKLTNVQYYTTISRNLAPWFYTPFYTPKVGIVSRFPVRYSDTLLLLREEKKAWYDMWKNRYVVMSSFITPKYKAFNVFCTHLGMGDSLFEGSQLTNFVKQHSNKTLLAISALGGDFNVLPEDALIKTIEEDFKNAGPGYTVYSYCVPGNPYCSGSPNRCDYIFTDKTVTLIDSKMLFNNKNGPFISDHSGVYVEI